MNAPLTEPQGSILGGTISQRPGERGFTLLEVAIAVAMLAIGLTTALTLQTRLVDNFSYERSAFRATLAAQYLMTFVDIETTAPDVGEKHEALGDALEHVGYFDELPEGISSRRSARAAFDGWTVDTRVVSNGFGPQEDVFRQVFLTVRWGEGAKDEVSLTYIAVTSSGLPQESGTRSPNSLTAGG